MIETPWRKRLAVARLRLLEKAPYFAPIVARFRLIECPGLGTIGVSKDLRLVVDGAWLSQLTIEQISGLLVHEIHHVILSHHDRWSLMGPDTSITIANLAGDMAINPSILMDNWTLPDDALLPKSQGLRPNLTMEMYYEELIKIKKENEEDRQKQGKGNPHQTNKPGIGEHCSGASGKCGMSLDPSVFKEEGEPINQETDEELSAEEAINECCERIVKEHNSFGKVPGNLVAAASRKVTKPKSDFVKTLRLLIQKFSGNVESGGMDYSKKRLSKKSLVYKRPIPSLISQQPVIAIVVDTSGSMWLSNVELAVTTIQTIIKGMGIDAVTIIQADTTITKVEKNVREKSLIDFKVVGGGGTSFDAALEYIEGCNPTPDVSVYITDGEGEVNYIPKKFKNIWLIVPRGSPNEQISKSGPIVKMS